MSFDVWDFFVLPLSVGAGCSTMQKTQLASMPNEARFVFCDILHYFNQPQRFPQSSIICSRHFSTVTAPWHLPRLL